MEKSWRVEGLRNISEIDSSDASELNTLKSEKNTDNSCLFYFLIYYYTKAMRTKYFIQYDVSDVL